MIEAKIIADSRNPWGQRLATYVLTFPRYILAELNTHRMFSRNSASSRAIPFKKMLEMVQKNPFIPIAWQKDHSGMQGTEYFTEQEKIDDLKWKWGNAVNSAVQTAQELHRREVTKQLCNRLLEPFMWHTVIVSATEWENFFALRCPRYYYAANGSYYRSKKDFAAQFTKDIGIGDPVNPAQISEFDWQQINKGQAEIHMMALAEAMWDAYNESTPAELKPGQWHIPFGEMIDLAKLMEGEDPNGEHFYADLEVRKVKVAVARCARISYTVVGEEGKPDNYINDVKLHDRLASSGHWSPFEHVAQCMTEEEYYGCLRGDGFVSIAEEMHDWDALAKKYGKEWHHHAILGVEPLIPIRLLLEKPMKLDDPRFGWDGNFQGFNQYRKTFSGENIK